MKLILDPEKEVFKWGPAPIRTFFCADFLEGIFAKNYFRRAFPDYEWPKGGALFKDRQMVFINQLEDMYRSGGKIFLDFMLPIHKRNEVFDAWKKDLELLEKNEKRILSLDLSSLNQEEFLNLWKEFHESTINFWTHVTAPELANYGSLPILEKELQKYIPEGEIHNAMEILTAPENPSFYQIEEMELRDTDDLHAHADKYFWLKNSYKSAENLDIEFFKERKKEINSNIRSNFEMHQLDVKNKKKNLVEKYNIENEAIAIADTIVFCIEWQDDRKKEIWKYIHFKDLLAEEAAKRLQVEKDDLFNFREIEITEMLKVGVADKVKIDFRRNNPYGFLCNDGLLKELNTEEGKIYWDTFIDINVEKNIKEFKGIVASKGENPIVRGKVKIIPDPALADGFEAGDILVTSMTTPEFVFLMKKAGGVITDTGGLTSHAAIVSRELKKVCIVGTKVATKVLKDGDIVEVDANTGIIKLLSR